jgi:hypothetical protein
VRTTHSSHEVEPEVVYEGRDETKAREALEHHLDMLRSEYADTADREFGTLRIIVTYSGGHRRPGLMMQARVSVSGTNEDGWSRIVWSMSGSAPALAPR